MRSFIVLAASVVWICSSCAIGQEKSPVLPQERFVGDWINQSDVVLTANRVSISRGDKTWLVEVFVPTVMIVAGTPKEGEASLGKAKLSLAGDDPDAKALPFGFAIRDLKLSVQYSTLRIEKEELIVETFTVFSDKSAKSNYRTLERFKKK